MKKIHLLALIYLLCAETFAVHAQPRVMKITLQDAIDLARQQSPDALLARHRFRNSYWQFRTYEAGFLPMLSLDATLPELNRSIDRITQPDGSEAFRDRRYLSSIMNLSLSKNIGFTGGQVFMNTNLQRIDIFADSTITSYLSTPLNIGFRQPLFAHNPFRWSRRIEPLRYNEAQRRYVEDMEQVAITAINYFFDLLLAQIRNQIQHLNSANNDTLYRINQGRFNMGTIAENELLQSELNLLSSNAQLESSLLELESKQFDLKSFLRLKQEDLIKLVPPSPTLQLRVDPNTAITHALSFRSDALSFERRLIEAESSVGKARSDGRFNANLYAVYGLTQSAAELKNAYLNPQDQQRLIVGVQVPILDWGLGRGKIKMAESSQELVKTSVEQEQIDFDRQVFLKVMQFNIQQNQLTIAARSDTVAQKRYQVTKQRYLIGKIGIVELNMAQTEKDNAVQGYISSLHNYWRNYYEMRKLTHFDYIRNEQISISLDELK
ncbi:MAG: TolC family protein [Bacteroidales bacterium]|nr:TolC family protein [Bacteroidales bacterium]MDZ4203506.1 TolC family protein [Bacteroidales bacterium]